MKRFYSQVTLATGDNGYSVLLDGKAVRTPGGRLLEIGERPLAEAIAAEWQAQQDTVEPESMPITQLASTAIDRITPERAVIIDRLVSYATTDLLCYRADSPQDLVQRQEDVWQPVVDWAAVSLGVELLVTSGVVPIAQPPSALAALRRIIEGYDVARLTGLQCAVAAMGSLLLGIALVEGKLGVDESFAAAQLDEVYQNELWGEDVEALKARQALRNDVAAAARFIELSMRKTPPMCH